MHRTRGKGVEGVHIDGIVESFRKMGHRVSVFSPGDRLANARGMQSCSREPVGPLLFLFDLLSRSAPEAFFEIAEMVHSSVSLRRLRRGYGRNSFDVIFERYAIFGTVGMHLSQLWGIPLLLEVNYTSLSDLVRPRSRLFKGRARSTDHRLFHAAECLFPVSTYLRDHLVSEFCVPEGKIMVLPNAADPNVFHPGILPAGSASGRAMAWKTVGFVGGFYPWHGLALLLDAFVSLSMEIGNLRLVLVGDGPERSNVERRIAAEGLSDRVVFPGRIPHEDLAPWISMFDIGVMPNSNEYGSPMKIFEYMAMGKPVVAADYGPLRDGIDHGVEGFLFPPGNATVLREYLKTLLTDDALCAKMSAAAQARVLDRHTWMGNSQRMLKFLSKGRD